MKLFYICVSNFDIRAKIVHAKIKNVFITYTYALYVTINTKRNIYIYLCVLQFKINTIHSMLATMFFQQTKAIATILPLKKVLI